MRISLLLLLSLLLLSLTSAGSAQPRPLGGKGKGKAATEKAHTLKPARWEVKALGQTIEEAEKEALAKARTLVAEYLRRQQPPLTWVPSLSYIREHLLSSVPQRHEDEDTRVEARTPTGEILVYPVRCWSWTVAVTPEQYGEMAREDQRARAGERMVLAAKVTGGLLFLLVAFAGYLRLDEWTQGAYTRWLLLALGSAAVGVGAGLVLLS
jgi:hypothetical protein